MGHLKLEGPLNIGSMARWKCWYYVVVHFAGTDDGNMLVKKNPKGTSDGVEELHFVETSENHKMDQSNHFIKKIFQKHSPTNTFHSHPWREDFPC